MFRSVSRPAVLKFINEAAGIALRHLAFARRFHISST